MKKDLDYFNFMPIFNTIWYQLEGILFLKEKIKDKDIKTYFPLKA